MSRIAYTQVDYIGGAIGATLASAVLPTDTTILINGTDATWGTLGEIAGFYLSLDYGTVSQEKIWVPQGTYNWSVGALFINNVVRG